MRKTSDPHENEDLPLQVIDPEDDSAVKAARSNHRTKLWLIPAIWFVLFAGAALGLYFQPPVLKKFYEITGLTPGGGTKTPIAVPAGVELPEEIAATLQETDVVGLGRLLPHGEVVTVALPFGASDARIAQLRVRQGDRVAAGEVLAVLDNLEQLEGDVDSARADVAVHEATLAQTRQSVSISLAESQAALERAEAAAEQARAEFERIQSLFDREMISQSSLDQARSTSIQADREVTQARATLSRYTSEELDHQPDVIVAARNVDAARAALARVERDLNKAFVKAPSAGTILKVHVRPGEQPGQEGVLDLGDIDNMMAEVEVYQSQIEQVRVGQPVEIVADALEDRLYGTVVEKGLKVERQSVVSDDAAALTDARVVQVTVALDEASSVKAARFTNLEIIARIDTTTTE